LDDGVVVVANDGAELRPVRVHGLAQILSGAKGLTISGQYHAANLRIAGSLRKSVLDRKGQFPVEGIEFIGSIKNEGEYPV